MEQLVARRAHNPKVTGSSPVPATIEKETLSLKKLRVFCLIGELFFSSLNEYNFFKFSAMYTVYVLYSVRYDKIHIGYTSNLKERLLSHNELSKKGWTIKFRPW